MNGEVPSRRCWTSGAGSPVGDHAALTTAISEVMDNRASPSESIGRANDFPAESSINAYEDAIAAVLNRSCAGADGAS